MKTGPWPYLQFRKYQKGEWKIVHAKRTSDTAMSLLQMSFYMSTTWLLKILYYFLVEFKSTTSFPKQSARLLSRPQVQTARRKIEGLILWDLIWSITGFICHHLIRQNSCWILTFIFLRTLAFRSEGPDVHRGEMQQEVFTPVLKIMILRNSPGGSHVG